MKKWSIKFVVILLVVAISVSAVVGAVFLLMQKEYPLRYKTIVSQAAAKYGVEEELVFAIISQESGFNPKAVSNKGAQGLMQIMPITANWISFELEIDLEENSIFDPEINIEFGCFYLNYLFSKFENEIAVLCAYNAGEGVVLNWLDESESFSVDGIPYSSTKEYVRKVLDSKKVYYTRLA